MDAGVPGVYTLNATAYFEGEDIDPVTVHTHPRSLSHSLTDKVVTGCEPQLPVERARRRLVHPTPYTLNPEPYTLNPKP